MGPGPGSAPAPIMGGPGLGAPPPPLPSRSMLGPGYGHMGRGMGMRDDRMLDRAAAPPLNAPISPPVVTTPPANPAPPPQPKFEVTLPPLNTGPPKFDVLQDGIFPSLQWLRQCGIALCRWAGENNDWSRLAFSLPDSLVATVIGPEGSALQDLQNRSGCRMKIERERFRGPMGPEKETSFLCLVPLPNPAFSLDPNIVLQNGLETFQNFMRGLVGRPLVSNNIVTSANSGTHGAPALSRDFLGLDALTKPGSVVPPLIATTGSKGGGDGDREGRDREGKGRNDRRSEDTVTTIGVSSFPPGASNLVARHTLIPRDAMGGLIGQGGKRLKEHCTAAGTRLTFRVPKPERGPGVESRPGSLDAQGPQEGVDAAINLVRELLLAAGKDYSEVGAAASFRPESRSGK